MPLSTSSFSHERLPIFKGRRFLVVIILLALFYLLMTEVLLGAKGYQASVLDDIALWATVREQASKPLAKPKVVLLGASRIQMGFSSNTFNNEYPEKKLLRLAINGHHPLATLKDLANDKDFSGLVICSLWARGVLPESFDDQQEYVDYYHNHWNWNRQFNRWLDTLRQQYFISSYPVTNLVQILKEWVDIGRWPKKPYVVTMADRSRDADFKLINPILHRRHREKKVENYYQNNPILSPVDWLNQAKKIKLWVEKIKNRGGDVVFIRFPTTGGTWLLDQQYYPRQQYWDKLSMLSGAKTLHFQDVDWQMPLVLPDTSHLDYRDKPLFTEILLKTLKDKNWL